MRVQIVSLLAVFLVSVSFCEAQGIKLTQTEQSAIVEKTITLLNQNYIFPQKVKVIESAVRKNSKAGRYSSVPVLEEFLSRLNTDIQESSGDKHLSINNNPRMVARIKSEAEGSTTVPPGYLEMLRSQNFRLRKIEMLEGNIGYFKFDNFVELEFVKEALTGAMDFLHYSDALILDLTDNGGGHSETADYLMSYFLPDSTVVGESWVRKTNEKKISVIRPAEGVRQMLSTPLYILVSSRTASAAEGVAYTLQQLHRAVVIGEQTKGLGNPGELFAINETLFIMIPTILNRNAVTGTNWDGTGVTPTIVIESTKSLDRAKIEALVKLGEIATNPREQFRYRFIAEAYESMLIPKQIPPTLQQACLGKYEGERMIVLENGSLFIAQGMSKRKLYYIDNQTFSVEGRTDFKLRFPLDGPSVKQCEILWYDHTSDKIQKLN